jgi:hypothetical protein
MRNRLFFWTCAAVLLMIGNPGCVRLGANLMRAVVGDERPAEYDGFKEQRVAVICTSGGRTTSGDSTSALLTRYVHMGLANNVKKIDLVKQEEVERVVESSVDQEVDFVELGNKLKANKILAIDITGMKLKNGATLYQGRCDIEVAVYDMGKKGDVVFRKDFPEFSYPKEGGPSITDTSEAKFRNRFLTIVAKKVADLFYPVDPTSDVALDATFNSF